MLYAIQLEVFMMKREYFNTEQDGFYGAYHPNSQKCHRAVILMLGDKIDDLMIGSLTSAKKRLQFYKFCGMIKT